MLTDVKSGSERLRDVRGVAQVERDEAWIQSQATPLSITVCTALPGESLAWGWA